MTNQSPAEALRQQILIDLTNANVEDYKYDFPNLSREELTAKCRKEAEETLAAYAATVEREARKDELKTLVDDNDAEEAAICHGGQGMHTEDEECFREYGRAAGVTQILDVARSRLAALQGPQDANAE